MRISVLLMALMLLSATGAVAGPRFAPLAAGDHYVAIGSSFAAGPGVTHSADTPPNRCSRSVDNCPHQLAARLGLILTDVSCGGATTDHILGAWNELPAQIDALRADTKLVTITIGGNDVGYIAGLFKASCALDASSNLCKGFAARGGTLSPEPDDAAWHALAARLDMIIAHVRKRAPFARLVFVDYLTILPRKTLCAEIPLSQSAADGARAKAARLAALTARVARRSGAMIIRASQISARHHVCAKPTWMNGFPVAGSPPDMVGYHPNLLGMTAVARKVELGLRGE